MYTVAILLVFPALTFAQIHFPGPLSPYNETARNLFNTIDTDGDGQVTRSELRVWVRTFDPDGSERIEFEEFRNQLHNLNPNFEGKEKDVFDMINVDGNSYLSEGDFFTIFDTTDTDGDGNVSESEFIAYWAVYFQQLDGVI